MAGSVQDVLLRTALEADRAWALIEAAADALAFSVQREGTYPHRLGSVTILEHNAGADLLLLPPEYEREPGELEVLAQHCGYRPVGSLQVAGRTRRNAREQALFLLAWLEQPDFCLPK